MNSLVLRPFFSKSLARAGLIGALASLCGCGNKDVEVYRVAKETNAMPPVAASAPQLGSAPTGGGQLEFKAPSGWESVAPGQMRAASFKVKGEGGKTADVGVFPLPGMAGSDLANVNRWRGQVGLAELDEDALAKAAEPVPMAGSQAKLFDMAGQNAGSGEKTRILAAIFRQQDMAWFFKMTGDDALVASQKPAFVEFLKSVSFNAPSVTALPASHPPIDNLAPTTAATAPGGAQPKWQVPTGWKEVPAGQFLVGKFQIESPGGGPASVNVSMSAGEGGGVVGNVNRWRKQIGLNEVSGDEAAKLASPVDVGAAKASLVDMSGTDPRTGSKTRLMAMIVPRDGQTWFYKLMGDEQLVEREKTAFTQFVRSVQY